MLAMSTEVPTLGRGPPGRDRPVSHGNSLSRHGYDEGFDAGEDVPAEAGSGRPLPGGFGGEENGEPGTRNSLGAGPRAPMAQPCAAGGSTCGELQDRYRDGGDGNDENENENEDGHDNGDDDDDEDDDDIGGFIVQDDGVGGGAFDGDSDSDDPFLPGSGDPALRLDAYVSKEKLVKLTGVADLTEVTHLEMRVDTTDNTLGDLGHLVPSLQQLKLSGSRISTVRDLGTSLKSLTVLWLSGVGLEELEGIGALPSLRELYAPFNEISDLSPLVSCEGLEVIDVEGNAISELAQVHFLAALTELRGLTLTSNPVTTVSDYRRSVIALLPTLEALDDVDIDPSPSAADRAATSDGGAENPSGASSSASSSASSGEDAGEDVGDGHGRAEPPRTPTRRALTDDDADRMLVGTPPARAEDIDPELRMVNEAIKYARLEDDAAARDPQIRTALAMSREGALVRPSSAIPGRYGRARSATSGSSMRPLTARMTRARSGPTSLASRVAGGSHAVPGGTSSSLTFGSGDVFCGNALRALRSRGGGAAGSASASSNSSASSSRSSSASGDRPYLTGMSAIEALGTTTALLDELVSWKSQHGDRFDFAASLSETLDKELLDQVDRVVVAAPPPRGGRPARSRPAGHPGRRPASASSAGLAARVPRPPPVATTSGAQAPPGPGSGPGSASSAGPFPPRAPEPPVSGRVRPQAKRTIVRMRSSSSSSSSSSGSNSSSTATPRPRNSDDLDADSNDHSPAMPNDFSQCAPMTPAPPL